MSEGLRRPDSTEVAAVSTRNARTASVPLVDRNRIPALVERANNDIGSIDDTSVMPSHRLDDTIHTYAPYRTWRFFGATGRLTARADTPLVRFSGGSTEEYEIHATNV